MTTIAELKAKQAELQKQIDKQISEERREVIKSISKMMADYEITIEDLQKKTAKPGSTTKAKSPAKYQHDGIKWSGFGRMPQKIKAYVEKGGNLEALAIK
jgi:DNA-binding protein H-NS